MAITYTITSTPPATFVYLAYAHGTTSHYARCGVCLKRTDEQQTEQLAYCCACGLRYHNKGRCRGGSALLTGTTPGHRPSYGNVCGRCYAEWASPKFT